MPWFFAFAAVVLLFVLFGPEIPIPKRNLGPERLRVLVDILFYRGFDGAELVVKSFRGGAGLRVRKHIAGENDVRLLSEIAVAGWPPAYRSTFQQGLDRIGVDYEYSARQDAASSESIVIDFRSDRERVVAVALLLFESVYGISLATRGFAYLKKIAAGNVRIGWTTRSTS